MDLCVLCMVFLFSLFRFNAYLSLSFGNLKNESSALTLLLLLQPKAEQNEPPCRAYAMLI